MDQIVLGGKIQDLTWSLVPSGKQTSLETVVCRQGLSVEMAQGIVETFPTPMSLVSALHACSSQADKLKLIQVEDSNYTAFSSKNGLQLLQYPYPKSTFRLRGVP